MEKKYEIVIRGNLPSHWMVAFEGMEIHIQPDGNTCIAGSLPDQSALYGLVMRLRDLGLSLVSVNAVDLKVEK